MESRPPELDKLFEGDGYLRTHESDLLLRWNKFTQLERSIEANEGGLAQVAFSYKQYGIVQRENGDVEVGVLLYWQSHIHCWQFIQPCQPQFTYTMYI